MPGSWISLKGLFYYEVLEAYGSLKKMGIFQLGGGVMTFSHFLGCLYFKMLFLGSGMDYMSGLFWLRPTPPPAALAQQMNE